MQNTKSNKLMIKITGMLDILICLLLFLSSLYKGGFYKEDTLFINMIICMLGLVCLTVKLIMNIKDDKVVTKSKLGTIIDSLMLVMPITYFLPVVFKTTASLESSIFETIRFVNLAIIYFIVRSTNNRKIYINALAIIGIVLAILGIDEITYRLLEPALNSISINYLDMANGRLSSTIQYANITALVMLLSSIIVEHKVINNLPLLVSSKRDNSRLIMLGLEMFCLILLQSAVVLTTSRMNIFLLIISTIMYGIYLIKNNKKNLAYLIFGILVISLLLVASIDGYLLSQKYMAILLTYVITLLIIIGYILLYSTKFKKYDKEIENKKNAHKFNRKYIILIGSVVVIIIAIMFIPKSLNISDNSEYLGNYVGRNIYDISVGKHTLDIKLDVKGENNYTINLYEVNEDLSKKQVVNILPSSLKDGEFKTTFEVSKNTTKLQLSIWVGKTKLSVEEFKIDNKDITLSYLFAPDILVFKLKDTLRNDTNNSLRMTYYIDALKLAKLSPIVGIGGEGFKSRYQEIQSTSYVSSEVHSVPLQILVESGIIGLATYIGITLLVYMIIYKLYKQKCEENNSLLYFLLFTSFVLTSTFDLVFSFGIMIYIYAVIIGLIVSEYKEKHKKSKDLYELDNKSLLGMVKIATLSLSLMALLVVTIYSISIYRASMLIVPKETEADLSNSYERVGMLEEKVKLDRYNVTYLSNLLDQYDSHISLLNSIYIMNSNEEARTKLKADINNYIVKQKDVADSLIEYEYYNKYVLDKVARCYLDNYVSYASIYKNNFKNSEIAYTFYIGYAIKLTNRLTEIGGKNKIAISFAYNIYNAYIPSLENENKLIGSKMLKEAIQDMKNKLDIIKEKTKSEN